MVTLHLSTAEALHILVAMTELMGRYEEHWANQPAEASDMIIQEREWYNETIQKVSSVVSEALEQDEGIRSYIASTDGVTTVESIIAFERGQ